MTKRARKDEEGREERVEGKRFKFRVKSESGVKTEDGVEGEKPKRR